MKGGMVAFALMFATTGCAAAHKGGPYAGMQPYDVGSAAQEIITQETATPASPLHDRELVVADEHKGVLPSTRRPAWVISMENFDHVKPKYCLYVWGRFTPFQGSPMSGTTSRAVRAAAASSALAVLAAGCGGSAALDRETAMQHAMDAVANEVAAPGSAIYRHRIQLRTAETYGRDGWLVRIADRTAGTRICVTDLPTETAIGVTENIAVVPCGSRSGNAPAERAPSSPPPA